jgi:signal transduction histidine kinase
VHDGRQATATATRRSRAVRAVAEPIVFLVLAAGGTFWSWRVSTQPWWITVPLSVWGLITTVLGLVLLRRQPRGNGRLVALAGVTYYISILRTVDAPVVFAVAFSTSYVWVAVLGHLAMSWARTFIRDRTVRVLTVLGYVAAIGTQCHRLWADSSLTPRELWWDEQGGRPSTTAETIGTTTLAVLIAGMFAFVLFRWLRSPRTRRRGTLPAWAYVVVVVALGFAVTVSSLTPLPTRTRLAFTAAISILVQVTVVVIPTLRRRQGWQVIRWLVAAPDSPATVTRAAHADEHVRTAGLPGLELTLRQVMDDPELRLYLIDGDTHRDVHGRAIPASAPEPGLIDWPVRWQGRRVAVVRLDEAWQQPNPAVTAALNAVGIAVEALRLESLASRQAAEIARSRHRLVTTALDERRRIERDLHDGAQQMLISVLTMIDDAEHHMVAQHDIDAARNDLWRAHKRLSAAIAEMRRLTRGLYPATLEHHGLAAAVEELRDTSPLPTVVTISAEGWSRPVEATAYFVIAESLTNAIKHATATAITVTVTEDDHTAVVVVRDNGTGLLRLNPAGGLQHLRDRVTALGGDLHIEASPADGSKVTARIPLNPSDDGTTNF